MKKNAFKLAIEELVAEEVTVVDTVAPTVVEPKSFEEVDDTLETTDALNTIANVLDEKVASGTEFSEVEEVAISTAIESIYRHAGLRSTKQLAKEDLHNKQKLYKLASEGISEGIKKMYEAVKAFFNKIINWVKDLYNKITKKTKQHDDLAKSQVDGLKKAKENNTKDPIENSFFRGDISNIIPIINSIRFDYEARDIIRFVNEVTDYVNYYNKGILEKFVYEIIDVLDIKFELGRISYEDLSKQFEEKVIKHKIDISKMANLSLMETIGDKQFKWVSDSYINTIGDYMENGYTLSKIRKNYNLDSRILLGNIGHIEILIAKNRDLSSGQQKLFAIIEDLIMKLNAKMDHLQAILNTTDVRELSNDLSRNTNVVIRMQCKLLKETLNTVTSLIPLQTQAFKVCEDISKYIVQSLESCTANVRK